MTNTEQLEALRTERIENVIFRIEKEGDIQAAQTVKSLYTRVQELESLDKSVFTVLEGFTLPHEVRKILETAYYNSIKVEEE